MGDLKKFLQSLDSTGKPKAPFSSNFPRTFFPDSVYPFRLGLVVYKSKQRDNVQPEFYNINHHLSTAEDFGKKIANTRGYVYRTEKFKKLRKLPCPKFWQKDEITSFKQSAKPFGGGTPKLQRVKSTSIPGPGTYTKDFIPKPKVKKLESFGGKTLIVPPVTIKCKPLMEDVCSDCKRVPVGVYYENRRDTLCRPCFEKLKLNSDRRKWREAEKIDSYKKVRHCSFFHDHQNSNAAVWLKPFKLLKKQQVLETYFNKYF